MKHLPVALCALVLSASSRLTALDALPFTLSALVEGAGGSQAAGGESPSSGNPFKDSSLFKDTERKSGGTVFFRGAFTYLPDDRGSEVFTDTLGTTTENDDQTGYAVGAGLDLDLGHDLLYGNLLGEIFVEYAQHSREKVTQATDVLLGGTTTSKVTVGQLSVIIAPKVMWDFGRIRPWLIPVGLGFLVNSPPSDDATYLDFGLHFGAGVEAVVLKPFSLGLDVRYTEGFGASDTKTDYLSVGVYLGVSF